MKVTRYDIAGEHLLLHPMKGVFWTGHRVLFVSNLNLTNSFLEESSYFPGGKMTELGLLLTTFPCDRAVFLGNLFNEEDERIREQFLETVKGLDHIDLEVVKDEADEEDSFLEENGFRVHHQRLIMSPFRIGHSSFEDNRKSLFDISGSEPMGERRPDLHQRLPCFYFSPNGAFLPSFNPLGPVSELPKDEGTDVFGIQDWEVFPLDDT